MKNYFEALIEGDCCECDREQCICREDSVCLKSQEEKLKEEKDAEESV